jgi:hypothetical protein
MLSHTDNGATEYQVGPVVGTVGPEKNQPAAKVPTIWVMPIHNAVLAPHAESCSKLHHGCIWCSCMQQTTRACNGITCCDDWVILKHNMETGENDVRFFPDKALADAHETKIDVV